MSRLSARLVTGAQIVASPVYALEVVLPAVGAGAIGLTAPGLWLTVVAVTVMLLVAGCRQLVLAFPDGGSCLSANRSHLGGPMRTLAGASLVMESALAVAVCLSAASALLTAVVPISPRSTVAVAALVLVLLIPLAQRKNPLTVSWIGLLPVAYIVSFLLMLFIGIRQSTVGGSDGTLSPGHELASPSVWLYLTLIGRMSVTVGAVVGGVERVNTTVPDVPRPRARFAATTLVSITLLALVCLGAATAVARRLQIGDPGPDPALSVLAEAASGPGSVLSFAMALTAASTLVLAAWTALHSLDRPIAAVVHARRVPASWGAGGGSRRPKWGIAVVGLLAGGSVLGFNAQPRNLVEIYAVAVFATIAMGQWAMVQRCRAVEVPAYERAARRQQRITVVLTAMIAAVATALFAVALTATTPAGGWLVPVMVIVLGAVFRALRGHYVGVALESSPDADIWVQPHSVHGIVIIYGWDAGNLKTLAYARASRLASLTAVTICEERNTAGTDDLVARWNKGGVQVPLKVLYADDDTVSPVVAYVENGRHLAPDAAFQVFVPRILVGRWWQRLLHDQVQRQLQRRLMLMRGVMVAEVGMDVTGAAGSRSTWKRAHGAVGR